MDERRVGEMSDEALLEGCRETVREGTWVDVVLGTRLGCGAAVVLFVLLVVGGHVALRGLLGGMGWVVSAGVVGVGFLSIVLRPSEAERRRMACWRQLRLRYTAVEVAAREEALAGETGDGARRAGADRVVVVGGVELPGGEGWLTRVWLWGNETGVVEWRELSGPGERVTAREGERPMTGAECERMRTLGEVEGVREGIETVPSGCKDGEPVQMAVWGRGVGAVWRARANLACVRAADRGRAAVRLMEAVRALGRGSRGREGEDENV